jgi:hypothetical protein
VTVSKKADFCQVVRNSCYIVPERKLGFFVKIKEDDPPPNFGGLTTVILVVFRGLKFESDADIGKKDRFRSGTI